MNRRLAGEMLRSIFLVQECPGTANRSFTEPLSALELHRPTFSVARDSEYLFVAAKAGRAAAFGELIARCEDRTFLLTSNITGNRAKSRLLRARMKPR